MTKVTIDRKLIERLSNCKASEPEQLYYMQKELRAALAEPALEQQLMKFTPETRTKLSYTNHDGACQEIKGCTLTVDKYGRHWIWSDQLEQNLVYKTKGLENTLLAAINSLLFTVQLRDKRIAKLQRIADLAQKFAADMTPDDNDEGKIK